MTPRDAASEAQAQAADPGASVWVSANAGSGRSGPAARRTSPARARSSPARSRRPAG